MTAITAIPRRRPRLYEADPRLVSRLEKNVLRGMSYAAAAAAAGVSETTWYRWRRQARMGDRVLGSLFRQLDDVRTLRRRVGGLATALWPAGGLIDPGDWTEFDRYAID